MKEFRSDILIINKKGQLYFYLSLAIILVIIAVLVLLQIIPVVLQVFSIILWLFAISRYLLQTKKQVLKKSIGELKIKAEEISFFNNTFKLSEITSIKISISGWRSYKRSQDRQFPVSEMHNGDKNILKVTVKDQIAKCEFLLSSKAHWGELREHVISWHCRNLNVLEDSNGGKTYGLKFLSYKEIQEFKKYLQAANNS